MFIYYSFNCYIKINITFATVHRKTALLQCDITYHIIKDKLIREHTYNCTHHAKKHERQKRCASYIIKTMITISE